MNITNMVRGMIGEAKPGEARVLELKTGQQVRGVVQSVSADGKEAVVQINGVAVRAVLESPMQPGQATWLQVSGQLEDGAILLKPSDGPNAQPMTSITDAIKQAGLPDEPWARQLVQEMQKNGVPITRENMMQLGNAMKMKPAGVSVEQWAQTIAVAMKRQLPLTSTGLTGLQQAMFGKPLNELLSNFLNQAQLMQGNMSYGLNGATVDVMKDAQALVRTLLAMMPSVTHATDTQAATLPGGHTNTAHAGSSAAQAGAGSQVTAQAQPAQGQGAPAGGMSQASAPAAGQAGAGLQASTQSQAGQAAAAASTAGVSAEAGRVAAQAQAGARTGAGQTATGAASGSASAAAAGSNAAQQGASPAQGGSTQAQAVHAGGMIGRMLTLLGVSHEHVMQRVLLAPNSAATAQPSPANAAPEQSAPPSASASAAAARSGAEAAPQPASAAAQAAAAQAMPQASAAQSVLGQQATAQQQSAQPAAQALQSAAADAHESLKSTLLQLLKSDSLPPAIRDSAQQIVQQITGQQLLLSGDRTQPFAHVTMFVPFVTEDGQQTAAVHIQSRQGRKGELDANNCRLWFDLDLKSLGHTMVDVNVIEKLVALNIHHEDKQVQEHLRPFRREIEAALESIGYQMSAYRVMPFPEKEESAPIAERLMKDYTVEDYKGVDLRI